MTTVRSQRVSQLDVDIIDVIILNFVWQTFESHHETLMTRKFLFYAKSFLSQRTLVQPRSRNAICMLRQRQSVSQSSFLQLLRLHHHKQHCLVTLSTTWFEMKANEENNSAAKYRSKKNNQQQTPLERLFKRSTGVLDIDRECFRFSSCLKGNSTFCRLVSDNLFSFFMELSWREENVFRLFRLMRWEFIEISMGCFLFYEHWKKFYVSQLMI